LIVRIARQRFRSELAIESKPAETRAKHAIFFVQRVAVAAARRAKRSIRAAVIKRADPRLSRAKCSLFPVAKEPTLQVAHTRKEHQCHFGKQPRTTKMADSLPVITRGDNAS
jgi:hypothetical protein